MSVDPAIFRALVAQGATPEMLLAVVEAAAAGEEARRAERREGNKRRQAEWRDRQRNARNALLPVTARDEGDAASSLDKKPPHTPQKINLISGVCESREREADPIAVPVFAKLTAMRLAAAVLAHLLAKRSAEQAPVAIVAAWNGMAGRTGLQTVQKLTAERRSRIRARIADHGVDAFTEAIAAVERSPFCLGDNERGWRADFDFILQPTSFNRLVEGSYDRASPVSAPGRSRGRRHDPEAIRNPLVAACAVAASGGSPG